MEIENQNKPNILGYELANSGAYRKPYKESILRHLINLVGIASVKNSSTYFIKDDNINSLLHKTNELYKIFAGSHERIKLPKRSANFRRNNTQLVLDTLNSEIDCIVIIGLKPTSQARQISQEYGSTYNLFFYNRKKSNDYPDRVDLSAYNAVEEISKLQTIRQKIIKVHPMFSLPAIEA